MASEAPFLNCWQRIDRANLHLDSLIAQWNAFDKSVEYERDLVADIHSDGTGTVRFISRPLPNEFALQFGEFLYQLRAALDGSVYASKILEQQGQAPANARQLEFPIFASRQEFDDYSRDMIPLSQRRKAFIESIQPYNAPHGSGLETLRTLHDLARKDRHRRLLIATRRPNNIGVQFSFSPSTEVEWLTGVDPTGAPKFDDEVARFRVKGDTVPEKGCFNAGLAIEITVEGVDGYLWNTLRDIIKDTSWIVNSLE